MRDSLVRMAEQDPQLAAHRLVIYNVGSYDVAIVDGNANVTSLDGNASSPNGRNEFELRTDARTFARLATGANPLRLMMNRRLRIRGARHRALALRKLAGDLTMREIAKRSNPDPDLLYRALPYAIDPTWTRGHHFCVRYTLTSDEAGPGGTWYVSVDDGSITVTSDAPERGEDGAAILSRSTWLRLLRGELTPNAAFQQALSDVEGSLFPITLLGRWIERAEGRDDAELKREVRQRAIQKRRAIWGSRVNGAGPGQGDPAHEAEAGRRRKGADLLDYGELYALWERQNWKAHEIDFSVDKEQWLATPTESQGETIWSTASFYLGEERVAADLAPFLLAAPTGEIEIFLATQLVDEARHAAFFDRFMGEVLALESDDLRGRQREMEEWMLSPWRHVFDDQLRGIARKIKARPDDFDLFVEGIVTYHMVIEGVLAMTGQHFILEYTREHGLYPGFVRGFSLVEQDEHRHIAFGVRFLRDVCAQEPRYRRLIEERIAELVPKAAHVFVPPYAKDPSNFVSYSYTSAEMYGYAYRTLKRRMAVIGAEVPPPEELMPGPIDAPEPALS
jgi:ribonucleoside-diphosphate reductase beta chain